jgi:hypothetical protein
MVRIDRRELGKPQKSLHQNDVPPGQKLTEIKTVRVPSSDLTMRLEGGEICLIAGICWYAHVFHRLK